MNNIDISQLKDRAKQLRVQPKSKEQILAELEEIEKQLGLYPTNGDMPMTHDIVKRVGSLTDVSFEMREKELQ